MQKNGKEVVANRGERRKINLEINFMIILATYYKRVLSYFLKRNIRQEFRKVKERIEIKMSCRSS